MILALILVFTFQPLRRFFERLTDRIFYRDKYDSQELLNQITQTLASEINLEVILEKTLAMIAQAVRVNFGQYIVFEKGEVYKIEHYGRMPEQVITKSEMKLLDRSMLVADEIEAGRRKEIMDKHHIRLSLVLRTKDEFVGFLLLGDKLSGDIYSTQDLELFEILANELAVAIVNAKAYEEISQFNVTLQDKVDEATKRLRVANNHLKELDQAKDEFISMASHQLRTPLTTIKGYISMLQEGDAGKLTKEQLEFLEYAYSGSERMVSLISDLLNVSRMSSGKFMIDRQPIDMVALVSEEVRQLVSHAEAKQLKLIWEPPAGKWPPAELDENKTRQVVMNFIDNAIYYTKQGSVTVTLKQVGDQIELRVTDTGIGVPQAARSKLFSKFFRAGNAQQVRPDGTGLGLYLAKRVIEDQGGKIIFESTEGKGSTFGFLLPMHAPTATKTKPAATKPAEVRTKIAVTT
ncbi:MAG TPA: GAF domain-containing sensor histidine kinase [Candidatus Saccharimonadales bacterium]|nr:GAF domain-containing sensor histidine kinase [Candidatus Saccharimonadales bacterium]